MKMIFCIDDNKGLMFNNRRQSRDKKLRQRILEITKGNKLWMSEYSSKQFTEGEFSVSDDFPSLSENEDYCFIENIDGSFENCNEIIIYKWNRAYPSDKKFDFDLDSNGFSQVSVFEFKGTSHEKITEEIFRKI